MLVEKNKEAPKKGLEAQLQGLENKTQKTVIDWRILFETAEKIEELGEKNTQKCCGVLEDTFLKNQEVAKLFGIQNVA